MSIVVENVVNYTNDAPGTAHSFAMTTTGHNRLLLVIANIFRGTAGGIDITAATYSGGPIGAYVSSEWTDAGVSRSFRTTIYQLLNPAASGTVAITANQNSIGTVITAIALSGVSQWYYSTNVATGNGTTSTTQSVTIPGARNGSWLIGGGFVRNGNTTFTPGTDVVELADVASGTSATDDIAAFAGYKIVTDNGDTVLDFTSSVARFWNMAALEIYAAGNVPPARRPRTYVRM